MLTEPVTVLSANSSVPVGLDYRGGEFGELVIIYNPATNSNNVFLRLRGDATTAAVTGQVVVSPGQYAFFILTQNDNASGINAIAATGNTVVTVIRQSFRSNSERLAVMGGVFGGAVAAQFWVAISGTQIQLSGPFVEARADTINAKTAANGLSLGSAMPSGGVRLGSAALIAGQVVLGVGTDAEWRMASSSITGRTANATRFGIDAANGVAVHNANPLAIFNGAASDLRHQFTVTDRQLRTVSAAAPPSNNTVGDLIELPIVNGATLAVGDLAEYPFGGIRVQINALGSLSIKGLVVSGGTGNAAGTVTALVRFTGIVAQTLVADTGGVAAGQLAIGGGVNVGRINSQATVEGSFAKVLLTAIATALTDVDLNGGNS